MKLESDLEIECRKHVQALGGELLKWTCPGRIGIMDRLLFLEGVPITPIEFKRERGGRFSPMQDFWHRWMSSRGFNPKRVDNFDQFKALLDELVERWMA